jgi:hypothetical protein
LHTFAVALVWREVNKENHALNERCCNRDSNGVGLGGITGTILLSCVTFWVVLRRMVFNSRRFGTMCLFHLHRRVDAK